MDGGWKVRGGNSKSLDEREPQGPGLCGSQPKGVSRHGHQTRSLERNPSKEAQGGSDGTSLAKLTRPTLNSVLPREPLFVRLDGARATRAIWISAPPGAGKTTLLASYLDQRKLPCLWYQVDAGDGDVATFFYYLGLAGRQAAPRARSPLPLFTPEHSAGLPAFSRRFFRGLCGRLKPPQFLVFDNYQNVTADSRLHEALREGLEEIPAGVKVAILSRGDPPPALARHRANQTLALIRPEELRLNAEEAASLARLRGAPEPAPEVLELAQGWAAGLVLLLEGGRARLNNPGIPATSHAVFDYFAGEIFQRAERKTQDFLMESAFLPRMMPETVAAVTAHRDAEGILEDLARDNYFTTRHEEPQRHYQYHPLFREFLLARARDGYSGQRLSALQRDSARLLAESGMVEDAAELYRQAGDWEGLARIVLGWAPQLTRQGRVQTVQRWLDALPAPVIENSPWLLFWAGECRIGNDAPGSRPYFERALAGFRELRDAKGVFLAWIREVASFRFDPTADMRHLDSWIALLDELLREYSAFPSPEIDVGATVSMLLAMLMRQPQNPAMRRWEERAMALYQARLSPAAKVEVGVFLQIYHTMLGDHAQAELELETARAAAAETEVPVLLQIYRLLGEALQSWAICRFAENLEAVRAALALAREAGVHVWDHELLAQGLYGTLTSWNLAAAREMLDELGKRRPDWSRYHVDAAWYGLLAGDLHMAFSHAETGLALAEREGRPFFIALAEGAMAEILWQLRRQDEAAEHLKRSDALVREIGTLWLTYGTALQTARFALESEDRSGARARLREAFTLGREHGYMNYTYWRREAMSRLCVEALQADIEPEYVLQLIRTRGLAPPEEYVDIGSWPWPVRVYTLGRFGVDLHGEALHFSGKAQKKVLELLKALIALGGHGVGLNRLAENLWPDLEGDAGQNACNVALHRLRNLLGDEAALVLSDGRLSLDPSRVWVDSWAFERLAAKVDEPAQRDSEPSADDVVELASGFFRQYPGNFLEGEEAPWAISHRERLRSKFLRAAAALGGRLEGTGGFERAEVLYRRALEVDPLAEAFHCGLMRCLKAQGRVAEALEAYRRCRDILSITLGVQPCRETQAVYLALKG